MDNKKIVLLPANLSLFAYNKNTDYQEKINQAVAEGNYQAAALYEQQRNEKIAGEGMKYEQTNNYSQYLNNGSSGGGSSGSSLYDRDTDYSALLNAAMNAGNTDADYLQGLLNSRMAKEQDPDYAKWSNADYDKQVQDYINNLNQNDWKKYIDQALAQIDSMYAAPSYEPSKFDTLKEQLATKALDMNYDDWLQSDQYKALANRYGLQGNQNMRDILGQISSRTGGLASSYATSAAQQQYNDYMAQLEAAAMDMFGNEQNQALQKAQEAYNYADADYQRYLDELAQYNGDRSFAYGVLSDAIAQSQYDKEWAQAQQDAEYAKSLDRAQTLASIGDFSGYRNLGYSEDEIANMQNAYQASLYKGTNPTKKTTTVEDTKKTETVKDTNTSANDVMDYDTAVNYLRNNGAGDRTTGIMTRSEWTRRKASYNQYGTGGVEVTEYDSYPEYLNAYIEYALQSK